jgi:hypothetical protein
MAALVIAALFFGNCFSCPQILLAATQQGDHSCCHRTKSVSQDCQTQGLRQYIKADPGAPAAVQPIVAEVVSAVPDAPAPEEFFVSSVRPDRTPPDLLAVLSVFRV